MEANDVDARSRVECEKLPHKIRVELGQLFLNLGNRAKATQNRPQSFAKPLLVGERQRGARDHPILPIGLDHRHVDSVERGTAHQPQRAPNFRARHPEVLWSGLGAYVR